MIVHQVLVDVCLDPEAGVVGKLDIFQWIVFSGRVNKPHISFLDQVLERNAITNKKAFRNFNHQAQIAVYQFAESLLIVFRSKPPGKGLFLFPVEDKSSNAGSYSPLPAMAKLSQLRATTARSTPTRRPVARPLGGETTVAG